MMKAIKRGFTTFTPKQSQLLIDGKWVNSASGKT